MPVEITATQRVVEHQIQVLKAMIAEMKGGLKADTKVNE